MKKIYIVASLSFLLIILFTLSNQVSAWFIIPHFNINVIVNNVGGDGNTNYDFSPYSGSLYNDCVDNLYLGHEDDENFEPTAGELKNCEHVKFSVLTQNGTGSFSLQTMVNEGQELYLIQASSSDWQLASVICASPNSKVITEPSTGGVKIISSQFSEITCTFTNTKKSATKTPVILIPGILGTQLIKNFDDNSEIWPAIGKVLTSISDDFMDVLAFKADGTEDPAFPIRVGDVMRKVEIAGNLVANTWDGMIAVFTAGGYTEGKDLFVFPYDWRKSNADDAILLAEKINSVLAQTGASKVDLIAHSMGGLVAQSYVATNGTNKVDKIFFIGTPHLGAPKAFKALMYGDDLGVGVGISDNVRIHVLNPMELKKIAQNFPSIYGLLPSQTYIDGNITPVKYVYDATASTTKWLNYDETKNFLIASGRNSAMFPQAESLHNSIDNFNLAGADVYNFSGCGLTKTIGDITIKKKKSWTSVWQKVVDDYRLGYTNGDGTVPLISAVGPFGNHNYYVKGADHSSLPSIVGVPETVLALLLGSSTPAEVNISSSNSFCDVPGRVVSTHSPVTLHIYDDLGHHTGPTATRDIEYGIPNVSYDIVEGDAFAFLPAGGNYRTVMKATDTGAYDFFVEDIGVNDEVVSQTYWNEIPLTTLATNSELDFSATNTNYIIKTDQGGDGIFESSSTPSAVLDSVSAQDLISPQTTVSVSATGTVSFFATDNMAGVLKTEYSLQESGQAFSSNIWNLYTTPFFASGKTINYFSTDKAGNIENTQTIVVPVAVIADKTIPEFVFCVDPKIFELQITGYDTISSTTINIKNITEKKKKDKKFSYTVSDMASNTSNLIIEINKENEHKLNYDISFPLIKGSRSASMIFVREVDKKGNLKTFIQTVKQGKDVIIYTYNVKKDKTIIRTRDGKQIDKKVYNENKVIEFITNKGLIELR